jgi:hypothetical protein
VDGGLGGAAMDSEAVIRRGINVTLFVRAARGACGKPWTCLSMDATRMMRNHITRPLSTWQGATRGESIRTGSA